MTLQNRIFTLGLVLAVSVGAMSFAQAQESEPSPATKQRTIAELEKALREVERAHKEMAELLSARLRLVRLDRVLEKKDPRRVLLTDAIARENKKNNLNTATRGALERMFMDQKIWAEYEVAQKAAAKTKVTTRTLSGNVAMQREMLETMHVLLREVRELRTLVESLRPQPSTSER